MKSQKNASPLYFDESSGPLGDLLIVASDEGLKAILWNSGTDLKRVRLDPSMTCEAMTRKSDHPILRDTHAQLREYFACKRLAFDLPLAPEGTPFQQKAWKILRTIPYGETISYQEQARILGSPLASRAVGAANGKNPISIVVPCHRVIGKNGSLTGFAGGISAKGRLLTLEKTGVPLR